MNRQTDTQAGRQIDGRKRWRLPLWPTHNRCSCACTSPLPFPCVRLGLGSWALPGYPVLRLCPSTLSTNHTQPHSPIDHMQGSHLAPHHSLSNTLVCYSSRCIGSPPRETSSAVPVLSCLMLACIFRLHFCQHTHTYPWFTGRSAPTAHQPPTTPWQPAVHGDALRRTIPVRLLKHPLTTTTLLHFILYIN